MPRVYKRKGYSRPHTKAGTRARELSKTRILKELRKQKFVMKKTAKALKVSEQGLRARMRMTGIRADILSGKIKCRGVDLTKRYHVVPMHPLNNEKKLRQAVKKYHTAEQIGKEYNVNCSTIRRWLAAYGLYQTKSQRQREEDHKIYEACMTHLTMTAAAKSLGISLNTLKRRATKLGCYHPNQAGVGITRQGKETDLKLILENRSLKHNTTCLKVRLIQAGILEDICNECGMTNTWMNKPLVIQLDHINGIRTDNRLENLRMLCPNCHSQTPTYCRATKGCDDPHGEIQKLQQLVNQERKGDK